MLGTHRSEFTYDGFRRRVRILENENGVRGSDTNVLWCESDICDLVVIFRLAVSR